VKRTFTGMQADIDISPASLPYAALPTVNGHAQISTTGAWAPGRGTSSQTTSFPASKTIGSRRIFEPDASIVLIGLRGSGKFTLAVMASGACRKRVVDVEILFQEATGFSTAKYRQQFGASNHNLRQEEILRNVLQAHEKSAIIVCNGSSLEHSGQLLLQEFSKTHPVIHIMRDLKSIHEHLEGLEMSKLQDLVVLSSPIFRHCSNYEFYNISETEPAFSVSCANHASVPPFLTLKWAERTFLKFVSLVTKPHTAHNYLPPLEPGSPLSEVATELRRYTCTVQIPLSELLSEHVDIEELEFGSDAFEIVVDQAELDPRIPQLTSDRAEDISRAVSRVRRNTVVPIIYHVVPITGRNSSRASYLEHLRHGLRMAPEFATIDLSLGEDLILQTIRIKGSTRIIGHVHAVYDWYSPFWFEKYDVAMRLGCDAVRFTRPAHFMDDHATLQGFRNKISERPKTIPLICFNTGRAGRRTACFNQVLTSVIPESLRESSKFSLMVESNPETSWLTAREITHALYASFIYEPLKFYDIGAHTRYSLSPATFNAAFKTCGMPHNFDTVQTPTLNSLEELVRDPNFGGAAIGLPFKIEVISLIHSLSRHARAIGVVNTLIPVRHLSDDGSIPEALELFQQRNQAGPVKALYGENTDWLSIRSCIRRWLSPANAVRPNTCGLVIGAGGMARAAVYAMLQLGVKNIIIFNRTYTNAEKLVAHFTRLVSSSNGGLLYSSNQSPQPTFRILRATEEPWPSDLHKPTIIVSCVPTHPVGDSPAPDFTIPTQWMQSPTGGVVIELAYRTLTTPIVRQMREEASRSWICLNSLDFLAEQGFAQFELFTGKRAPRRIMREKILRSWTDREGQPDPTMVEYRLEAIDDPEP
jgi:shikimate 5-dehydrogenase/shikimate kinase